MRRSTAVWVVSLALQLSLHIPGLAGIRFIEHTSDTGTHGTAGIYACDIDGDTDVVSGSSDQGSNEVKWWENQGGVPVGEAAPQPQCLQTGQNYPNPFTGHTAFEFPGMVFGVDVCATSLSVFDIEGRLIATISPPACLGGECQVTWDGNDHRGNPAGPGVYLYRLDQDSQPIGGRMVPVR